MKILSKIGRNTVLMAVFAAGLSVWLAGNALGQNPSATSAPADGVTDITLTSEVLVKDCSPFGIMLGGDAYYSGAALMKDRARCNFEGTSYRETPWGPGMTENGLISWFGASEEWQKILKDTEVTILSGPAKGTKAKLIGWEPIDYKDGGKGARKLTLWKLDKKIPPMDSMSALLVESFRLHDGQFRKLDGHWTSKDNAIQIGDVPPGSFGVAALNLNASKEPALVRFSTAYQRYMDTNGVWHARFWAKKKSGNPKMQVQCERTEYGEKKDVDLTDTWKKYDLSLQVTKVPEPKDAKDNPHLTFTFHVQDGEVLLDDVEFSKDGDTNPTAFRDDVVAVLKKYGVGGPLRHLQMGGNTLRNTIMPPLKAHSFDSEVSAKAGPYEGHSHAPYGLHQLYELCEYLGSEPWYSLPGTLHVEEMKEFMEYLAAPADVGLGKLRAELGHPKPWTESLKKIHVEFGNEAWNNATPYKIGGYNGPDYWKDLIAAAKSSPYYQKNVIFHSAGQASGGNMSAKIMQNAPNADRYAVAPYAIQNLTPADMKLLNDADKFYRWAFAWVMYRARNKNGAMFQNAENSRQSGIELSVYEINHHTTHGEGVLEDRNRLVTSLGGGLNVGNNMLVNLKEHGARTQVLFSLIQHSYNAEGIGPVRLWGTCLNMRKGQERYRPTFLACELANKAIFGNLVATKQSGADPTFEATGQFPGGKGVETTKGWPTILSYGFEDGKRRGLIVVNLDTQQDRPVRVNFTGQAQGGKARSYLLWSPDINDNNEFENPEPKVKIAEEELANFASGFPIKMPAHSMRALVWEVK